MAGHSHDYETRGDAQWLEGDGYYSSSPGKTTISSSGTSRSGLEPTIERIFHMRVLKEVAQLLRTYPALPLILTKNRISVPCTAPSGFPMSVQTEGGRYIVRLGEWRDEFVLADEVVELIEAAFRGEVRIRIDLDARGRHCSAERRLANGEWIRLPHHSDAGAAPVMIGPVRTLFLCNGQALA